MFRKTIYGTCVQFRSPEISLKTDGNSASVGRVLDRLTASRVHELRTARQTDTHYARLWRLSPKTILRARTGISWKSHPTPADTAPRDGNGRGQKPVAQPARVRRQWSW